MDLESLRIFQTVAAERSITHASARLGRAPSNVTTRIQQLEADLGVALFVRAGKRMTLSRAGESFLDYAQRLLALEEEARHVVTGGADGGVLHIGCMESTAASRLPELIAAYHTRFPATRLEISTGPSRFLLEQVHSGKMDCAFAALSPVADGTEASATGDTAKHAMAETAMPADLGLSAQAVWREDLLLLLPSHETGVSSARQVRTRSLAAFKPGCTYRAIAEAQLGVAGDPTWRVQEIGSYHAMIACVAAGACTALVPRSVLTLSGPLPALPILDAGQADTCLVWRTGYDVPAFQHLRVLIDAQRESAS